MKGRAISLVATVCAIGLLAGCASGTTKQEVDPLCFNSDTGYTEKTITVNGTDITFRAYENIQYLTNPIDPSGQVMNFYVPSQYYSDGTVGRFDSQSAPIFFPNSIGGYMPSTPAVPSLQGSIDALTSRAGLAGGAQTGQPNASLYALMKGYVVAAPGTRGRTSTAADGTYIGKAPAALIDLKAAVRYLHYNDALMPGDATKIISNGTSAGGAMSLLLGATGDSAEYDAYLREVGAADASDAIFAASVYCPITNLDNADMAYEWIFQGNNDYSMMDFAVVDGKFQRNMVKGTLDAQQIEYSNELAKMFPAYLQSLQLRDEQGNLLTVSDDRTGSFTNYMESVLAASAQYALTGGTDFSGVDWVTTDGQNVQDVDFEGYRMAQQRMKPTIAFDSVMVTNPENSEFGTADINALHFTEFSLLRDEAGVGIANEEIIRMLNPMYYIDDPGATVCDNWRIRVGEADANTALTISAMLTLKLRNAGHAVDYFVPWGVGHAGDYDLEQLFGWIDALV